MSVFPIAAITDEFSLDFDTSLDAMAKVGMTGAELRLIGDKNIIELSDGEIDSLRERVERRGMRVLGIASPVLKCVLPDAPPLDERWQQDVFGSAYTIADQPRLARRAFEIAKRECQHPVGDPGNAVAEHGEAQGSVIQHSENQEAPLAADLRERVADDLTRVEVIVTHARHGEWFGGVCCRHGHSFR